VSLFGNDFESQMGRALFQQDLYRRMFDDFERRDDARHELEFQERLKKQDDFWEKINGLIETINSTTSDLDSFYADRDLAEALNENGRVFHVINKMNEYREEYQVVAKEFISRSSEGNEIFINQQFMPKALKYFKVLNIHALSLQPFILMSRTFNDASRNFYGPIDERITAITENEDLRNLDFDREAWNSAYITYDEAKVAWGDANVAIIRDWDPWIEKDIQKTLDDYAKVTATMYRAGNNFIKHLDKVEKMLERVWEIRKAAEIAAQVSQPNNQAQDSFSKIEKLAHLLQIGAITEEEFKTKKSELLGEI
jgi:hypothetical protein